MLFIFEKIAIIYSVITLFIIELLYQTFLTLYKGTQHSINSLKKNVVDTFFELLSDLIMLIIDFLQALIEGLSIGWNKALYTTSQLKQDLKEHLTVICILFLMRVFLLLLIPFFLSACYEPPDRLERIQSIGQMKVLTRNSPSIYYQGPLCPTCFEYELVKRFSDKLGVKLKVLVEPNARELLHQLDKHKGDFAAAKLLITPQRQSKYLFTVPYHKVTYQLVYRSGTRRPKKLAQIPRLSIEISSDDSLISVLQNLKKKYPKLKWTVNPTASPEDLMQLVNEGLVDFTIASSDEIKLNRRYYPELRLAFDINKPQDIAWAFEKTDDLSLYNAANNFLKQQKKSGALEALREQHFGYIKSFDYVGTRFFQRHIITRLPKFQPWFEKAGKDNKMDWTLLAAISYQESHWNPDARSPTGVRGLMMLTRDTAKHIGVNNRVEPHQSIFGGAYYFTRLYKRLPHEIKDPDRLYFALAAYNLGYGHLRDALKLLKQSEKDHTKWVNLKKVLPLLRKKKWHEKLQYGYARGDEAVKYVENIRSYYDILKWEMARKWRENNDKPPIKALEIIPPAL